MTTPNHYIPALGHRWLTPLYDPFLRWVFQEEKLKRRLVAQANFQAGQRVLDLGCGTATLTLMIKQAYPAAEVVGLDGDPEVLAIGRAKAAQAGLEITLDHGLAFQLPYPDRSFDRVVSSLVFHHLETGDKYRTLKEVARILKSDSELYLLDFGEPRSALSRLAATFVRHFERVADNIDGRLPVMMCEAGLTEVQAIEHFDSIMGTITLYRARDGTQ